MSFMEFLYVNYFPKNVYHIIGDVLHVEPDVSFVERL